MKDNEFGLPSDLTEALLKAGIFTDDGKADKAISKTLEIPDHIRQPYQENTPLTMPSIGDLKNHEATVEGPFEPFYRPSTEQEPAFDDKVQFLMDILALRPSLDDDLMNNDPNCGATQDMSLMVDPDSFYETLDLETLTWARRAAFQLAYVSFDHADDIFNEFADAFPDEHWGTSADRWMNMIKAADNELYQDALLCIEFMSTNKANYYLIQRMIAGSLMQIAYHQDTTKIQATVVPPFLADDDTTVMPDFLQEPNIPIELPIMRQPFDATTFSDSELQDHLLLGELLADTNSPYDAQTNNIVDVAEDDLKELAPDSDQAFIINVMRIRQVADKDIGTTDKFFWYSANMSRTLTGKQAHRVSQKLVHRARMAAYLICDVDKTDLTEVAGIHIMNTDNPMPDMPAPWVAIEEDGNTHVYDDDDLTKKIDVCMALLGDTPVESSLVRSALWLTIRQIYQWRRLQESRTD